MAVTLVEDCKIVHERGDYWLLGIDNRIGTCLYLSEKLNQINIHYMLTEVLSV